jgi:hypothetical protein
MAMKRWMIVTALGLAAHGRAVADVPLAGCPTVTPVALGAKLAANRLETYTADAGRISVCVDKALYPYKGPGRGHVLVACFSVRSGKHRDRFCGDGETATDFDGYRIHISLRKPRFTESSEVWLEVDRIAPSHASPDRKPMTP